jgi:hypothetical protein
MVDVGTLVNFGAQRSRGRAQFDLVSYYLCYILCKFSNFHQVITLSASVV